MMRFGGLLPGAACASSLFALAAAAGGEIHWASSYGEARKAAADRNVLLMIDFWADW